MSKKTNVVAALEQVNEVKTTKRIKENYRLSGITSRIAVINETEKLIASNYKNAIKSLIVDLMTDANVDIISINFVRSVVSTNDLEGNSTSNLTNIPEKYTITRQGDFVNIGIDNYLNEQWKVHNTIYVIFTVFSTNPVTFEVESESKTVNIRQAESPDFLTDYLVALHYIYCAFVENLK